MLAVIGLPLLLATASPSLPVASAQAWDFRERIESETIAAFAPTANGQLWMATRSGLRKWNGRKLTRMLPNEIGAASSDVFALAGREQRLWAALGGGLVACDETNGQWLCQQSLRGISGLLVNQHWRSAAEPTHSDFALIAAPKAMGGAPIVAVLETPSTLWLATAKGLWRTAVPSSWPPSLADQPAWRVPLGNESQTVLSLRTRKDGHLLVGTQAGLFEVQAQAATSLWRGPVTDVAEDHNGRLWVGTPLGVHRLDPAGAVTFDVSHGLPDNMVQALAVDHANALWVGTRRGLVRIANNKLVNLSEHLPHPDVTALALDSDKGMWVALRAGGALRAQKKLVFNFGPEQGLPSFGLNGIAVNDQGVWISDKTSVWLRPPAGSTWQHVPLETSMRPSKQTLQGFVHDAQGELWVAEVGQGLWHREATRWTPWRSPELQKLPGPWALAFDDKGKLWIGGSDGALLVFHVDRKSIGALAIVATHKPAATSGCLSPVTSVLPSPDGTTLIGTDGGGVWTVEGESLQCFTAKQGLTQPRVSRMVAEGGGVWLGSAEGALTFFDRKSFVTLTEQDGLPCDAISALAVISSNLYFSCGAGVGIVSLADLHSRVKGSTARLPHIHFNRLVGMRSDETVYEAHPAAVADAQGNYWTLTRGGVSQIVLPNASRLPAAPSVDIEHVVIDGRFYAPGRIAIRGDAVDVEVRLQARAISGARATLFDKRLVGKETTLFDYSAPESTVYKHLAPGTYRFTARARGAHGLWGPLNETVWLSITLPLYKRPWVLGAAVALALALAFALHRRKLHRLAVGYQAVQIERERIARDLHDGLGQGFMALRFHLETLRRTFTQPSPQTLDLMAQSTEILRKVEDESRRTIWNLRAKSVDEQTLAQSLHALAKRTEGSVVGGGLRVLVETTGAGHTGDAQIDSEMLQVAGEAVRNAVNHARAQEIHITLDIDDAELRLAVYDDGCGFDPNVAPDSRAGHFGVLGMQERVRRLRGSMTIESIPDQGTAVVATVPRALPKDRP